MVFSSVLAYRHPVIKLACLAGHRMPLVYGARILPENPSHSRHYLTISSVEPPQIYRVAVPSPLRRLFDYLPPAEGGDRPVPGGRVTVPFGRRQVTGMVIAVASHSDQQLAKLKSVSAVLDREPLIPAPLLQF